MVAVTFAVGIIVRCGPQGLLWVLWDSHFMSLVAHHGSHHCGSHRCGYHGSAQFGSCGYACRAPLTLRLSLRLSLVGLDSPSVRTFMMGDRITQSLPASESKTFLGMVHLIILIRCLYIFIYTYSPKLF